MQPTSITFPQAERTTQFLDRLWDQPFRTIQRWLALKPNTMIVGVTCKEGACPLHRLIWESTGVHFDVNSQEVVYPDAWPTYAGTRDLSRDLKRIVDGVDGLDPAFRNGSSGAATCVPVTARQFRAVVRKLELSFPRVVRRKHIDYYNHSARKAAPAQTDEIPF